MASPEATALLTRLVEDGDRDVTADGDDLFVHGRRFARITDRALIVDLPPLRAEDLLERGIAEAAAPADGAAGVWVAVADREDWHELASEARDFVGEPHAGHDS